MLVSELRTGDRIELKGKSGFLLEVMHCEHGMSKLVSVLDDAEPTITVSLTEREITSGLVVIGQQHVIEEEIDETPRL